MRSRAGLAIRGLCSVALGVAIAATLPGLAQADDEPPLPPRELRAQGGSDTWRTDSDYVLRWDNPTGQDPPIAAVHHRVRNAMGMVVAEQRIDWAVDLLEGTLPEEAGTYTAEVWLENSDEEEGPPASVKLRFDDARPAQLGPIGISGWLGRGAFPHTVRLNYPLSEIPASGINGYAIAIDSLAEGDPCAAADRCAANETDLHGGLDGNAFVIAGLPEGISHIHAVAVSGSGMKSVPTSHGVLSVDLKDPVTRLAGVPDDWTNKPVALTATATDAASGMKVDAQSPAPFTALRVDDGSPKTEVGSSVSTTVIADGAHRIAFYARDAAGNVNDGGTTNGLLNPKPSTAVVRIDRSPPSIAFAKTEDPGNPELIRVLMRDPLSGPEPRLGSIEVRLVGSGDRFEALQTEPTPTGFQAHWDSESYPPGTYEFRAVGYDVAGNGTSTESRADGRRMALGNPIKQLSVLQAGFGGRVLGWHRCPKRRVNRRCGRKAFREISQPTERTVRFGNRVLFGGRLSAGLGAPLNDVEVQIVERFGNGSAPLERVSTTRTRGDGTFFLRLPQGPSRQVTAVFRGAPALTRSTTTAVWLGVLSGVSLRASSTVAKVGGPPLIFQGKVAATRNDIPSGGTSVELQFRVPGLPWSEFRTVQTDSRGRFRYPYRFSDDDSRGVRFQFRAYVPKQSSWLYEPAGSKPVAVSGR